METVTVFIFLGSKSLQMMTAAMKLKDACSLEEKWWPTCILKNRYITLLTKVCLVKAMVFPVIVYGCKLDYKAVCWRIDVLELWCWRRLLRDPWIARSNQSILKEIRPEYSLEGLMLKRKFPYFGYLLWRMTHWKRPWCWEGLKVGEGDDRGWDVWMASLTQWTWVWVNFESWWWTGRPRVLQSMGSKGVGYDWATELNWIDIMNHLEVTCLK